MLAGGCDCARVYQLQGTQAQNGLNSLPIAKLLADIRLPIYPGLLEQRSKVPASRLEELQGKLGKTWIHSSVCMAIMISKKHRDL